MKRRILKWFLLGSVAVVGLIFAALVFIVSSFGGEDTIHLVQKATSPDGEYEAEIREAVTPMHGGPDRMEVTLKSKEDAFPVTVFSRKFECGPDHKGNELHWTSPETLTVVYAACDPRDRYASDEDLVWEQMKSFREVRIQYEKSSYISHGETN